MSNIEIDKSNTYRKQEHKHPPAAPKDNSFKELMKKEKKHSKPSLFTLAEKYSKKKEEGSTLIGELHEELKNIEGFVFDEWSASAIQGSNGVNLGGVDALDAQVEILFEKILDGIEVIRSHGETTTRLLLNPPNPFSIFNGAEIEITQVDTDPLTYSLEFFGSEQANFVFSGAFDLLEQKLKENFKERELCRVDFSLRSKHSRVNRGSKSR